VSSINDLENTKKPLKSKVITSKLLQSLDCVLLATDHDNFDYELIKKHSKLIIDTRGKFKKSRKIIQA
jgi:UDP-N-acetyl-D-glucosamine dehydrogenase